MSFATIIYWPFLALVVAGLWCVPDRYRKAWLLVSSYLFYASWSIPYMLLLFGVATLNHLGAKWIIAAPNRDSRGRWVIFANLLVLGTFKYAGWLADTTNSLANLLGARDLVRVPSWQVPLGISFFVFEGISYTVDVVRKREKPHSFWDFQLFIAFFPKLVAGPILRAKEFLPQVERPLESRNIDGRAALRQIVIGLFLKVIFADGLAPRIDHAFARPVETLTTADVWMMAMAFGLQVYFDFSGYTRIAIGSAKLCGIDLVQNFDHPLMSMNPPELWRRWHISLSRWIRDYLFYPLAQRATARARSKGTLSKLGERALLARAAFSSMVIFGVWHGAAWKFVVWGAYQGAVLGAYHLLRPNEPTARAPSAPGPIVASVTSVLSWACMSMVTTIGWFFFRGADLRHAGRLCQLALTPWAHPGRSLPYYFIVRTVGIWACVVAFGFVATRVLANRRPPWLQWFAWLPASVRAAGEGIVLGVMFVLGLIFLGQSTFIYFQF
jgi:D-alanyl-lipoteichoic acid acyltransferase DltB (MBOAT superfamily)